MEYYLEILRKLTLEEAVYLNEVRGCTFELNNGAVTKVNLEAKDGRRKNIRE